MPRSVLSSIRSELESTRNTNPLLVFVSISHADLTTPIRAVNDMATEDGVAVTYVYDGGTYTAFPFEIEILTDSESHPRGRLTIQNVDRSMGEAVRALTSPPSLVINIIPASEFDLTVNPRVAASGSPDEIVPIYTATGLTIKNISVDVLSLSGDIESLDDASEPWPYVRARQGRLPGLFR